MRKRLLAVFAHPDDEAFGPGGTIAKYASEGVEVHLLCATRGESGKWHEDSKKMHKRIDMKVHHIREEELERSAKALGVARVEYMDFIDGELCNNLYHKIAEKIIKKINEFKPQIIITLDRLGISGHIDHITISMVTTYSFLKTKEPKKLYYEVMTKEQRAQEERLDDYFIYFPEGYDESQTTTKIDYSKYWDKKHKAMWQHQSQLDDVKAILKSLQNRPKIDYFILQHYRNVKVNFPETDLFSGIKNSD